MEGRESGMPDEAYWSSFFDHEAALEQLLSGSRECENVVEFGCGYGTFTLPAARRASGIVTALDIETDLLEIVARKADAARLGNVRVALRDFVAEGTGLDNGTQSHAMIFNLLHLEDPVALLREAYRVLQHGGSLSVIHWRRDIPTPRSPSLSIRPSPQQCRTWMEEAGFRSVHSVDLEGYCPYHFGPVGSK